MKAIVLIARILFSLIFLITGMSDFSDVKISYAAFQGVPLPYLLVPLSGMISVLAALSIIFGFKAKTGAWLIILFIMPVTFIMNRFWAVSNTQQMLLQMNTFIENLSILGGALFIAYFGPGPLSFDAKPQKPISSETVKIDFTYDRILSDHKSQFFSNDHSL